MNHSPPASSPGMPRWDVSDMTCRIDLDLLRASTDAADGRLPPSQRAPIPLPPPPRTAAKPAPPGPSADPSLAQTLRRILAPATAPNAPLWRQPRVLVVAAAATVIAVALGVVLMPASRGDLRVDIRGGEDARGEIFVDGVKHCDVSPCVARGLKPGQHTVQVFAPGRHAQPMVAEVIPGQHNGVLIMLSTTPPVACPAALPANAPQTSMHTSALQPRAGADPAVVIVSPHAPRAAMR